MRKFLGIKKAVAATLCGVMVITSAATGKSIVPTSVTVFAASEWNASSVYTGGDEVTYNGSTYRAKWWTQGETPGSAAVWELVSGSGNTGGNGGETSNQGGNTGGGISGGNATVTYNPGTGKNIQGITLPGNYYNKKVVGYFPNYALESDAHEHFNIADLQWDKLTHIQYAFGIVNKNTCELEAGDPKNDYQDRLSNVSFVHKGQTIQMDETLGYYGQFNIMHTLKKMYPNVTVLISTGGWGASEGLWYATQNEASMRKFSQSAVAFIRRYGFDGIDIDFEFPSETPLSGNYTDFTESIRSGISNRYAQFIRILSEDLAAASRQDGKYYWLTSAVSASSWVLGGQTNSDFLDYLDFVSVMSYDYHGGWNNYVENQANIYPDPADGETATQAVKTLGFEWSYRFYRGKVQSEKILMGVPYYTRGWTNVSGGTNGLHGTSGTPLTNATDNLNLWCDLDANGNEVAAGANPLWHVMNVMKNNSNYKVYRDDVGKVPHIWNAQNNTFLTYEDTTSVQARIDYVKNNNLGGVLIWVMHGDYDYNAQTGKYEVGDTLTSMFKEQFAAAGASQVTSDLDYHNQVLNFDVDYSGGKYDHPNYTYSIKVTNKSGADWASGFTFSFDLPKSSEFTSSWGGTYSVTSKDNSFNTVTLTSNSACGNGQTVEFTGMMKCCFSAMKNFKVNGLNQLSEMNAEITRLNRSYLNEENGSGEDVTGENPTTTTTTTTTQPQSFNAFEKIEAESYSAKSGMVPDPNSNASGGYNMGGITNGSYLQYNNVNFSSNASAITLQYSSKSGDAQGNVEVYVDSLSNKVGTVALANTGSDWSNYVSLTGDLTTTINSGKHTVYLKFVTTGSKAYVCNFDYFKFVQGSVVNTSASLNVNGYQISTTAEGFRTIYTVTDPANEVSAAGLVYGLASGCSEADLTVGSTNANVYSYAATEDGKVSFAETSAPNAQSYAMTMKFNKTASFYNATIYVRAYAKVGNSYIYSAVKSVKVYDLANTLYQNKMMPNYAGHQYLYNNILKVANPSYTEVDYNWNNYFVK